MPWTQRTYDAVVVGSGPNGLAAANELAAAGLSTLVLEAADTPGGGARTQARTLPGFRHDVCSAVHPLAYASPYFRTLDLGQHGLAWRHSPAPLAHVLDHERTIVLERSIEATATQLGPDADAYRRLLHPLVERWDELVPMLLAGLRFPSSPLLFARFGLHALRSMEGLARRFRDPATGALLGGMAAHPMLRLDAAASASFALVLGAAAHAVGWPIAQGGSQAIVDALVACFRARGGEIVTGVHVTRIDALPPARAYLFDVGVNQLLTIAGDRLSPAYHRALSRFRAGTAVFKVDWALSAPIPWRDPRCRRAATVHLAGDLRTLAAAEAATHAGQRADPPFVLVVQPSLFDETRAPPGAHTAWAYCHVPLGSREDHTAEIEAQLERYAPGFRDCVLARSTLDPAALERYDANYVGGDIGGGASDLRQLFFRPRVALDPYSTSADDIFLCSSSTPPGAGVHGMCGYWAAKSALESVFGKRAQGLAIGA